ncbi:MAG TPA: MFS transporter [Gemmataceae bacterium]|nr:MFS transporter [Gemmataceae bacterium]
MTETSANPARSASRAALLTVFLVVFIDLLGFGIVLPLLPRYADRLLEPAGITGQLSGWVIGGLLSVFSLMQFIFAPIWGRISDRVGRRPILLIGLVGSVVFYALFGYASSLMGSGSEPVSADTAKLILWLMFVARAGAGVAGATISTAQAVIADCTPKEKRAHGMALIGAAFGIGFTFGPLLAGLAMIFLPGHPEFAGYAASTLSLLALILAIAKMPETRREDSLSPRRNWLDVRGLFSTLQTPTVGRLVTTFFLATFGFAGFEGTLALLNQEIYPKNDEINYWIFAYVGFVLMLTQGFLYRKLVKKHHEVRLMRVGVGFMFLGLVGLAAVAMADQEMQLRKLMYFIALALGVVGFAFLTPSAQALISKRSDPSRQGEVLGVNQSFSALARILGPLTGVVLFKLESSHVLPYTASAVMLAIVMILLIGVGPTGANKKEEPVPTV